MSSASRFACAAEKPCIGEAVTILVPSNILAKSLPAANVGNIVFCIRYHIPTFSDFFSEYSTRHDVSRNEILRVILRYIDTIGKIKGRFPLVYLSVFV